VTRIVVWNPGMPPLGRAVAALGVFDGVHLGHQALVREAVMLARTHDAASLVVTFDRDPDQVVAPAAAAPQLLDLDRKLSLLADLGPDAITVMPFTPELAATAPLAFLDEVLLGAMTPVEVVVGYDFRFGHRAEGDVDTLVRYGADHGFSVVAHELVRADGEPITSTRVRTLVARGDVAGAERLLGRPHRVRGTVHHGRGAGAGIGFATANLTVDPFAALPAPGVYAGRTVIDEVAYPAAVSVGTPPTFPEARDDFEVHVIGYEGDLYGRSLEIEFLSRLRDQRAFDSPHTLAEAIGDDVAASVRIAAARG
jgi:riboflavin kinase / FMN adenylyltransferase